MRKLSTFFIVQTRDAYEGSKGSTLIGAAQFPTTTCEGNDGLVVDKVDGTIVFRKPFDRCCLNVCQTVVI
jgi:hypothetical protein